MIVLTFAIGLALGSLCGWLAKSVQVIEQRDARIAWLIRELQTEEKVERFDWSSISPLP